jgi:hypothetical protein
MYITDLFGQPATSETIERTFSLLNTLRRPSLPDDDSHVFHDWVLVRKKGAELGFVDSEYQRAGHRGLWGKGELLLSQVYFYAGFDDVARYSGDLPFGVAWTDNRQQVIAKLAPFEATRRAYTTDTWDVPGYRLTVDYAGADQHPDRVLCRQLPLPLPHPADISWPTLDVLVHNFGTAVNDPQFRALWGGQLDEEKLQEAVQEGQIDFRDNFGATLSLAASEGAPLFRAITLHRNRDSDSVGWGGAMPHGLGFEDSPSTLFAKIKPEPAQQADSVNTGHAVWHFDDHTLHVLYSRIDNRLLRVKLLAPGVWKCVDDA